jgi:hypothetical protein
MLKGLGDPRYSLKGFTLKVNRSIGGRISSMVLFRIWHEGGIETIFNDVLGQGTGFESDIDAYRFDHFLSNHSIKLVQV